MKKILIKVLNILSNKKLVLFDDFYKEVEKIAKENNESFFSVKVEKSSNRLDGVQYEYQAYINNFNWFSGKTTKEVVDKLKSSKKEEKDKENIILV